MIRRFTSSFAFVALLSACAVASDGASSSVAAATASTASSGSTDPMDHLNVLAAADMEGRGTGTPGFQRAADYVAAKLMWDHAAEVDALLKDFAEKFFGPAAVPMGKYVGLMDGALRDSPHCTGSAWDMPHHYPPAVRKKAAALLADAAGLAGKGVYAERVRVVADSFEMLEAFVAMLDSRATCDFVLARKELDRLDASLRHEPAPLMPNVPSM